MDTFIIIYIPVVVLILFSFMLAYFIYSNKQLIKELEEDAKLNDTEIKNVIDAVNYNDKKLFDNQKYIFDVYEENNNFTNSKSEKKVEENTDQYFNMMKNYDALISLTK
jgi:uncharacterized protein YneF (UPF0154 family)